MKKQLLILFLAILWLNVNGQNCKSLVWADEFENNGSPNPSNWGYDIGNSGYGNNEVQNYTNTSENVRIENGILIIEAKKGANGWTSARLKSQGKKSFTYGRIEFRAKLPAGSGTWPALWMLGEDIGSAGWPACGEIDIMEHVGKNPGVVQAALHTPSSSGNTNNHGSISVNDFSTAFHIYAVEWTETKMEFYVDNNLYYTYAPSVRNDQTWPFNKPQFIIMNIAMGGNWGSDTKYETNGLKNGIDPTLSAVRMEVDYVRYYSTEAPKISGPSEIKEGEAVSFSVPTTIGATYQWNVPSDVTVSGGLNSNKINVTWGSTPGNVNLSMSSTCGTVDLTFPILVKFLPTTPVYQIYNSTNSTDVKWVEIPTLGNSISLSMVPELEINYNVTKPALFPTIKYSIGGVADLSYYNYVSLTLKTSNSNPPHNIRLDIFDALGNYNSTTIFKITDFINDDKFHVYSGYIASVWPFSLAAVKELKLYINFGTNAPAGQGVCWLGNVSFSKDQILKTNILENGKFHFKTFPNPAQNYLQVEPSSEIFTIRVLNSAGQQVLFFKNPEELNIESLSAGIYQIMITDKRKEVYSHSFIKI